MYWEVTLVKPLDNYQLYVEVRNGQKGVFDMSPYLEKGMFRELKNPEYFNRVSVLLGAVSWPNGQDIAPETLLAELKND